MGETKQTAAPCRIHLKRYLLLLFAVLLLMGVFFLIGRHSGKQTAAKDEPELSAVALSDRLEEAKELVTMSYYYTNMGQFKNSSEFYGVTLPFTTKSFILTYDGVIKAGVDLSEAEVEVSADTVNIVLPRAKILSHTIDETSLRVFDEKTSIFNPFTVEDYNGFQRDQKAVMEEKAVANDVLRFAEERAKKMVREILEPLLPDSAGVSVICG